MDELADVVVPGMSGEMGRAPRRTRTVTGVGSDR